MGMIGAPAGSSSSFFGLSISSWISSTVKSKFLCANSCCRLLFFRTINPALCLSPPVLFFVPVTIGFPVGLNVSQPDCQALPPVHLKRDLSLLSVHIINILVTEPMSIIVAKYRSPMPSDQGSIIDRKSSYLSMFRLNNQMDSIFMTK